MDVRPLNTEADHDWALAEIAPTFDAPPPLGTPEAARFDVLAALIEHYEARRWPIEPPDAVEAIRHRMAASGLGQSDLARLLGSRSRASEILARKRPLTMEQAALLHRAWNIPAEALVRPMAAERDAAPPAPSPSPGAPPRPADPARQYVALRAALAAADAPAEPPPTCAAASPARPR